MRSRQTQRENADPAFLNEKDARKQAERQLLLDALSGDVQAAPIEWAPGTITVIAPSLLASPRLQLRPWTDADRDPFAAMTSDPEVMRHFPAVLSREESDAWIDRALRKFGERGWGFSTWLTAHSRRSSPASPALTFPTRNGLWAPVSKWAGGSRNGSGAWAWPARRAAWPCASGLNLWACGRSSR